MARRIDHRRDYGWDTRLVYQTLTNPDYLKRRSAVLGGKGAGVIEHSADSADGAATDSPVRYRLRHGVHAHDLPSAVRTVLRGDLTIDRVETWRPAGDRGYTGTVVVTIPGMAGDLNGTMTLSDLADGGCQLVISGTVRVPIPLVGGKIEEAVVDQIRHLLDTEHKFTEDWLREHHEPA